MVPVDLKCSFSMPSYAMRWPSRLSKRRTPITTSISAEDFLRHLNCCNRIWPACIKCQMGNRLDEFLSERTGLPTQRLPLPAGDLFDLPRASLSNYPLVDLADPNFVPPGGLAPPPPTPPTPPQTTQTPQGGYQSRLRGASRWR